MILAGLIFRTRETVGLIVILAIFAHPGIGLAIVAVIVIIAVYRSVSEPPESD